MGTNIKQYSITSPWLQTDCGLGEAPFWERTRNHLRFVDIVKKHMYFVDLDHGPSSLQKHQLDFSISTTADIRGNSEEFIFGGKLGYGLYQRGTGATRWLKRMWNDEKRTSDDGGTPRKGETREQRMRSNDGAVDAYGRYWVGAMNDPVVVDGNLTDEGVLFRLDPDLTLHPVLLGLTIPNGMSWTADSKGFYFTDTPTRTITFFPYNAEDGTIALDGSKTFFTSPFEDGAPDGHCQDADGHLWVCMFGAGKVLRLDPDGNTVAQVDVPTRCVTCPVICGESLYICSAEEEDPDKYPDSARLQGCVFKIDIGVGPGPVYDFQPTVPL